MSKFHRRAWMAGAEEYGRVRAEKYGRWARAWQAIQLFACVLLVIGIVWAAQHGR